MAKKAKKSAGQPRTQPRAGKAPSPSGRALPRYDDRPAPKTGEARRPEAPARSPRYGDTEPDDPRRAEYGITAGEREGLGDDDVDLGADDVGGDELEDEE